MRLNFILHRGYEAVNNWIELFFELRLFDTL